MDSTPGVLKWPSSPGLSHPFLVASEDPGLLLLDLGNRTPANPQPPSSTILACPPQGDVSILGII
jgi:hypothetical protein